MMPTYTFFAVDKGNMTLIQFTNGITMLVDCRRSDNRPSPLEYLQTKGLTSLDFMVVTHPHRDHLSGLQEVCEALKPKYLWHNGRYFEPDPIYDDWLYYERLRGGKVSSCTPVQVKSGQAATIGNARIAVAGPPKKYLEGTPDDENNNGIILSITTANSKVVITGDTQIEQWDVVDLNTLTHPAVFLASHHGRESGLSTRVMEAIAAQRIVISDGEPAETDATETYREYAPVSTTRENSVVFRPQPREERLPQLDRG